MTACTSTPGRYAANRSIDSPQTSSEGVRAKNHTYLRHMHKHVDIGRLHQRDGTNWYSGRYLACVLSAMACQETFPSWLPLCLYLALWASDLGSNDRSAGDGQSQCSLLMQGLALFVHGMLTSLYAQLLVKMK